MNFLILLILMVSSCSWGYFLRRQGHVRDRVFWVSLAVINFFYLVGLYQGYNFPK